MSYLDQLKQLVAGMFENATDKQDIDKLSQINTAIDGVQEEQNTLMDKNAELIASYKKVVKHTSFEGENNRNNDISSTPITFEDALKNFIEKGSN